MSRSLLWKYGIALALVLAVLAACLLGNSHAALAFLPLLGSVGGLLGGGGGIGSALGGGGGAPVSLTKGDTNFNGSSQRTAQQRQLVIGGVILALVLAAALVAIPFSRRKP